jgi:2-iminobutanoate/2-iminopropanoate deaminase
MQTPIFSPAAPPPAGFYSQAVRAGNLLFISGQLPLNNQGKLIEGDVAAQATQTLANIQHILEAAGATTAQLVQVTLYITSIDHWPAVNAAYQSFLAGVPVPPARAVVPVKELHFGALVEIQATAVLVS